MSWWFSVEATFQSKQRLRKKRAAATHRSESKLKLIMKISQPQLHIYTNFKPFAGVCAFTWENVVVACASIQLPPACQCGWSAYMLKYGKQRIQHLIFQSLSNLNIQKTENFELSATLLLKGGKCSTKSVRPKLWPRKIARTVSISTLESLYLSASCLNTDVTLAGAGTT